MMSYLEHVNFLEYSHTVRAMEIVDTTRDILLHLVKSVVSQIVELIYCTRTQ